MTEREFEELLFLYPELLLEEGLKAVDRQRTYAVGRSDLIFEHARGYRLVVEVKKGIAPRGVGDQLHDYWGAEKAKHPNTPIELMVVANEIPRERKLHLANWNIESREISEKKLRDVARDQGYIFKSEQARVIPSIVASVGQEPVLSSTVTEVKAHPSQKSPGDIEEILRLWCTRIGLETLPRKDNVKGTGFSSYLYLNKTKYYLFAHWSNSKIEVHFDCLKSFYPFSSEEKRLRLLDMLNQIPGIAIPRHMITKLPRLSLEVLGAPEAMSRFLKAFEWVVEEIKRC